MSASGQRASPSSRSSPGDANHDADAVARARQGDTEAFRTLVERHSRAVYRVAYRLTGSAADAEDVVQDAFLKAYRQLDRFESRASFGTWMHRIATNCALDLLRGRARLAAPEDAETLERVAADGHLGGAHAWSPERLLSSAEVGERVRAGLAGLSALERAAFVLRHLEGQTIEQIAAALGVGDSAAKHCVFRAVRKMRIALAPFAE